MVEHILARGQRKAEMIAEMQTWRANVTLYVAQQHPQISFLPLSVLASHPRCQGVLDQALLNQAMTKLAAHLARYGSFEVLDPARVWVGMALSAKDSSAFGGFYHPNQGYRYLQQIALTSLCGAFSDQPIDPTLRTLELVRAYSHDTLHYNTYRLYCPLLSSSSISSFYRLQYGINFRRWDGMSYSTKDPARARTTRNLGTIMEGATDHFAHQITFSLAKASGYTPDSAGAPLLCDVLFRDCTGQMTTTDVRWLRALERGEQQAPLPQNAQSYLLSLRRFVQYVTLRYRHFLEEFDAGAQESHLHHLIIESMLTGNMKRLCAYFDRKQSSKGSFMRLFKSSSYVPFRHEEERKTPEA